MLVRQLVRQHDVCVCAGVSARSAPSAAAASRPRTGCARRASRSTTSPASPATPAAASCPPASSSRCTRTGCSASLTTSRRLTEAPFLLMVRIETPVFYCSNCFVDNKIATDSRNNTIINQTQQSYKLNASLVLSKYQ